MPLPQHNPKPAAPDSLKAAPQAHSSSCTTNRRASLQTSHLLAEPLCERSQRVLGGRIEAAS